MAGYIQIKDGQVSTPVQLIIDLFGAIVAFWTVIQILIFIDPQVLQSANTIMYVFLACALASLTHLLLRALHLGRALRYGLRSSSSEFSRWALVTYASIFPKRWLSKVARQAFHHDWLYLATLLFIFFSFFALAAGFISTRLDSRQIAQEELRQRGLGFSPESYRNAVYFQNELSLELFSEAGVTEEMFSLTLNRPAPFTGRPMLHELIDRADCDDLAMAPSDLAHISSVQARDESLIFARQTCNERITTFLKLFGAEVRSENGLVEMAWARLQPILGLTVPNSSSEDSLDPGNLGSRYALLDERGRPDFDWNGVPDDFDSDGYEDGLAVSLLSHALSRRAGHLSARLLSDYQLSLDGDMFLPFGATPPDNPNFVRLHNLAVADPLTAVASLEHVGGDEPSERPSWTRAEIEEMRTALCKHTPGRSALLAEHEGLEVEPCEKTVGANAHRQSVASDWVSGLVLTSTGSDAANFLVDEFTFDRKVTTGPVAESRKTTDGDTLIFRRQLGQRRFEEQSPVNFYRLFWAFSESKRGIFTAASIPNEGSDFFIGDNHIVELRSVDDELDASIDYTALIGKDSIQLAKGYQRLAIDLPPELVNRRLPLTTRVRVSNGDVLIGVKTTSQGSVPVLTKIDNQSGGLLELPNLKTVELLAFVPPSSENPGLFLEGVELKYGLECGNGVAGILSGGKVSETDHTPDFSDPETCRVIVPYPVEATFEASGFGSFDLDFTVELVSDFDRELSSCDWSNEEAESVLSANGTTANLEVGTVVLEPGCYRLTTNDLSDLNRAFDLRVQAKEVTQAKGFLRSKPLTTPVGRFVVEPEDEVAIWNAVWIDLSEMTGLQTITIDGFSGDLDFELHDSEGNLLNSSTSTGIPETGSFDLTAAATLRIFSFGDEELGPFNLEFGNN